MKLQINQFWIILKNYTRINSNANEYEADVLNTFLRNTQNFTKNVWAH